MRASVRVIATYFSYLSYIYIYIDDRKEGERPFPGGREGAYTYTRAHVREGFHDCAP